MLTAAAPSRMRTFFDELRHREFSRLDAQNHAYLDYTGSAVYGESQIRAHQTLLLEGLYGNPHSEHAPSRASSEVIESARRRVLAFFGVDGDTHDLCFTANTTAAVRLVAESYPFGPETACALTVDNHNSVNGIREYASRAGARLRLIPLDDELRLHDAERILEEESRRGGGLIAFPAQSNFSGVRHPLSLVARAQELGFDVLLDAAAFVPGHPLSLRDCPADFVALSFYKLFGYPTGLGALISRRGTLEKLRRPWFSGGTVLYASVNANTHRLRPRHEGFEDGTPDFLSIAALNPGFDLLEEAGMSRIAAHGARLTERFIEGVRSLRHGTGVPVVRLYGPDDLTDRGAAVAFNVCDHVGQVIACEEVEARASRVGVSLRAGCFCNPGATESALALDAQSLNACLEQLGENFRIDLLRTCIGRPVGAVRLSAGLATNDDDIDRALSVLASFRE